MTVWSFNWPWNASHENHLEPGRRFPIEDKVINNYNKFSNYPKRISVLANERF